MADKTKARAVGSRKIGIKWKMFAILLVFIVATVAVIWTFQVALLNVFYQNTKFAELELSAEKLTVAASDEEALENMAYDCAEEYFSFIVVFKIEDGVARAMIEAGNRSDSLMSFFSKDDLQALYDSAIDNGGSYVATVSRNASLLEHNSDDRFVFEEYSETKLPIGRSKWANAVNVKLALTAEENYFIVQTVELMPVNAVVKTLNKQFWWIGIILILMALGLTGIMSRLITKPIIKMNAAAQKLALGQYDTDFNGNGYREICELSDALNYASLELAKTDKLQKELISNVSHDLRTPLTMIKGYGEVMRDIPGENTPENVQVIIDETERLTCLVNDMLDMSKLQSGTRKPDIQLFSLTQAIRDTMKRYEKLTMQDGYNIEFYADEDIDVWADSVMMLQVVYNLINNAINYTGDDKSVTVRQTVNGEKVRISVCDTGSGIAKEDLPLIWDRYYKVDKTHKRAMVGTGLGLSIVKEILEVHKAEFGVNSTLGEGSTFWFELDIALGDVDVYEG